MRFAITGANGQLGTDLVVCCRNQAIPVVPLTHRDLEITSMEAVRRVLTETTADVIINTAAMHNVENCEREPLRAYEVNPGGEESCDCRVRDEREVVAREHGLRF